MVKMSCVEMIFGVSAVMWSGGAITPTLWMAGERVCVLGNGAELATEPIWRLLTPNFLLGWQEMPFWFKALLVRCSVSFTKIFKYSVIMHWGKNYLLPIDSHSPIIFFARKQEVPMGLKMLQTCFPIFTPQSWVYNAILVCHSLG